MIYLKSDSDSIKKCAENLKNGNIIIIPTDTVYGFSGIVDSVHFTQEKIKKIKGRDEKKPFIQLIACPDDIKKYTDDEIPSELLKFWPGPLTIIVHDKNSDSTTAYRCPDDEWLSAILKEVGKPVYSTSANRSGSPLLEKISDIKKEFSSDVDLIIAGGDIIGGISSTIAAVENGKIKVLRQGSVKIC